MGISFKCEIKGLNNLERKLSKIVKELPEKVEEGIEDVLKNIQGYAIRLEYGHNQDGILIEMIETSTMKVKGRVYTSKEAMPHAMFEHWGTGQFAEMEHIGTTKHFLETGYTEWYIPVSKVERALNYPIKIINDQQFYIAHGAKANHFMTDAEFQTRNDNADIVQKRIYQMLKEVCK